MVTKHISIQRLLIIKWTKFIQSWPKAYSSLESADNIWDTGKLHLPVKPVYCHQVHNMYIITIYCYYQVWKGKNSQLNEEISDGEQKSTTVRVELNW